MLFALSDQVWMAGIAAALILIPLIVNATVTIFTAWFQTRTLNAASQVRSDKMIDTVREQSETMTRMEGKVAEVAKTKSPQDVVLVNQEPIPVIETEPAKKHAPRKQ